MRLTDGFLEKQPLPFTAYEDNYVYENGVLVRGTVSTITIIKHGIRHEVGATAPSITAIDQHGQEFWGSADNYYPTKQDAEAEIAEALREQVRLLYRDLRRALKGLSKLDADDKWKAMLASIPTGVPEELQP